MALLPKERRRRIAWTDLAAAMPEMHTTAQRTLAELTNCDILVQPGRTVAVRGKALSAVAHP